MASILVVVTFIAGSAWGPLVTMQQFPSREACLFQRHQVARQIADVAATNVVGGAFVEEAAGTLRVVLNGAAAREMARVSCT